MKYRNVDESDLAWMIEHRNHPSTKVWVGDSAEVSLEQQTAWFKSGGADHIMVAYTDHDIIGLIRVRPNGEVGGDVRVDHRGKGHYRRLFGDALSIYPAASHWLYVFAENRRAVRVYEKYNFIVDSDAAVVWKWRQFPHDSHPEAKPYVRMIRRKP